MGIARAGGAHHKVPLLPAPWGRVLVFSGTAAHLHFQWDCGNSCSPHPLSRVTMATMPLGNCSCSGVWATCWDMQFVPIHPRHGIRQQDCLVSPVPRLTVIGKRLKREAAPLGTPHSNFGGQQIQRSVVGELWRVVHEAPDGGGFILRGVNFDLRDGNFDPTSKCEFRSQGC